MVDMAIDAGLDDQGMLPDGAIADLRVVTDMPAAQALIAAITPDMIHTGYQHPVFLATWLESVGCRPMFVQMRANGHGPVLLPLEICANGIAGFCGGRHANGSFPVGRPEDIAALADLGPDACIDTLRRAGLPTSAIILERQHRHWNGISNPFVSPASVPSPNPALSLELQGGFDKVLAKRSGKRKRKKWRNQNRKLEAIGAVTYLHPAPVDQIPMLLDRFFALKAIRFREAGISDVFADQKTRAFFRGLFTSGMATSPHSYEVHALMVGNEAVAIIGCTIHDGRLTVEFGTFDERFYNAGPGELLFFSAIRHACERGVSTFDFGIGDETYKRGWCDIETHHADTAIGLSAFGKARALLHVTRSRLVARVKADPRLWAFARKIRQMRSGSSVRP